ncbi:MAG: hypothetical protein ABSA68_15755 [Xanthobacteraceae bacterium]|jgi:alpha-glucosidase
MTVRRRDFLVAGVSAVAAAALEQKTSAQPAVVASEKHPVGEFILDRTDNSLRVTHRRNPDRVLWESAADGNFVIAEKAAADIRAFGAPEGSYKIRDTVAETFERPSIDAIDLATGRASV